MPIQTMPARTAMTGVLAATALIAATLTMSGDSLADSPKEQVIDARQGYYQVVRHNAGILFGMARGDITYDAASAQAAADNLVLMTKVDAGSMWVAGTSKEEMPGKTRALKRIWDTWPAIAGKSKAWEEAVTAMAATASDGLDAIRARAGALGAGCKGCHGTFRADNF